MAFFGEMILGFVEIFSSPFKDLTVIWVLAPIVFMWLVLEIYFGKHKSEKLGWNTALGNGMTMLWISLNLIKYLFAETPPDKWIKFAVMLAFLIYGLMVIFTSFKHKVSEKTAFMVAAPTPIYYFAGIATLWAYGTLDISFIILLDIVLLFFIILILTKILQHFLKSAPDSGGEFGGGSRGEESRGGEGGLLGSTPGLGGTEDMMKMPELDKDMDLGKDFKF
jgi:hypothetical protein